MKKTDLNHNNLGIFDLLDQHQSKIMMMVWDGKGGIRSAWISKELERLYGLSAEDFVDKRLHDLYSPSEANRQLSLISRAIRLNSVVRGVSHFSNANGEFWQDTTLTPSAPSADDAIVFCQISDITKNRQEENQLKRTTTIHLDFLHKKCNDLFGSGICDMKGDLVETNAKLCELLGDASCNAVLTRAPNVMGLMRLPENTSPKANWESLLGSPIVVMEVDLICADRSLKRVTLYKYFGPGDQRGPCNHLFFVDSRLDTHQMHTARADTEYLLEILSNLPSTRVDVYTRKGQLMSTWCPDKLEKRLGFPLSKCTNGHYLYDFMIDLEAQRKISLFEDTLDSKTGYREEFYFKTPHSETWQDVSAIPIKLSSGEEFVVTAFTDITERKLAEEERLKSEIQLQQAQKMEAIGRISAGIAHDFGNRLSIVLGYGTLIKSMMNGNSEIQEKLETLIQATKQASALTKQLLTFSRNDVSHNTPINLHEQLRKAVDILEHSIDKRIRIQLDLRAESPTISADATQIQNVFLNLIINAADAMPSGGDLKIHTNNRELSGKEPEFRDASLSSGKYVIVTIEDTGTGIAEKELSKIFEPFYTTKTLGKGTGLGLSVVARTLKNYAGAITVNSTVNVGTTFTLFFPALEHKEEVIGFAETKKDLVPGSGNILIIDDEVVVLQMISDCLKTAGYHVKTKSSPIEALHLLRTPSEKVDLVLLDLMMPEMSGKELYEAIRKFSPNLKVLIISAYSDTGMVGELLNAGADGYLEKPMTAASLTWKVAEVLQ